MILKSLELTNFRNLAPISLEFDPRITIIYGDNAQGKTNLMESIWLLSGQKSFRGSKEKELIAFGCDAAKISATFFTEGRDQTLDVSVTPARKIWLNGIKQKNISDILGKFPAVIFSPEELSLVKDGPA